MLSFDTILIRICCYRGLGKTVTSLALILSQQETVPGPTLIVAPVSVLGSWADHIQALCPDDTSCYMYHGPNRNRNSAVLSSSVVVLTTYATLAADMKDGALKGLHGLVHPTRRIPTCLIVV